MGLRRWVCVSASLGVCLCDSDSSVLVGCSICAPEADVAGRCCRARSLQILRGCGVLRAHGDAARRVILVHRPVRKQDQPAADSPRLPAHLWPAVFHAPDVRRVLPAGRNSRYPERFRFADRCHGRVSSSVARSQPTRLLHCGQRRCSRYRLCRQVRVLDALHSGCILVPACSGQLSPERWRGLPQH